MLAVSTRVTTVVLAWALVASAGQTNAQQLPASEWGETVFSTEESALPFVDPSGGTTPQAGMGGTLPQARTIDVSELPQAMTQTRREELREVVERGTVPVRAVFRRDPLVIPNTVEVWGAATLVRSASGEAVLITAQYLVHGAEVVEIETPDGLVQARVESDPHYGLAVLALEADPTEFAEPIPLAGAGADTEDQVFSSGDGGGTTLGPGEDLYGFYQLNSLGVVLGYPLVNREGEIVGVGSHRYPPDPSLTLSVPASAVRSFLGLEEGEETR